jgi:hypothetical protein
MKFAKTVLERMTDSFLAKRTARFNSAKGVVGRRYPRVTLTGHLADAVGNAQAGSAISLRIRGTVVGRGVRGQKNEVTVEIESVTT